MMITKAFKITKCHIPGKTRLIGDVREEAIAAKPPAIKKVIIATLFVLIPTKNAPSQFCAMAIIVEPIYVFLRNKYNKIITDIAATIINILWSVKVKPNKFTT